MKTSFYSLRFTLLALLFAATTMVSCKEDDDAPKPEPVTDVATKVSGNYTYSELTYGNETKPADETNLKGTIKLTRKTEKTVDVKLDIKVKSTNDEFMVYTVEDVQLTEDGTAVNLIYDNEQVATIKNNKLVVNAVDEEGVSFSIAAKK